MSAIHERSLQLNDLVLLHCSRTENLVQVDMMLHQSLLLLSNNDASNLVRRMTCVLGQPALCILAALLGATVDQGAVTSPPNF